MVSRLAEWTGEELRVERDHASNAWLIAAVHSRHAGPAIGGTRMRTYDSVESAIEDALRLSTGMTRKNAVAGLPVGGGKAVLAIPPNLDDQAREALLVRHGKLIESFGGTFWTGPDLGTSEPDMDLIARSTSHVVCRPIESGGSGTASPWTATGVFHGMRASIRYALGTDSFEGVRVLVQGAGAVGGALAQRLDDAGATVLVSDVDGAQAQRVAEGLRRGSVIAPETVFEAACDVFAPNAVGGILNDATIARLTARVVAGAANNQLREPADAERLMRRGILYAPDYVINAGGIIRAVGIELLGWTELLVDERIERIHDTLTRLYAESEDRGISTAAAADALADQAMLAIA